MLIVLLTLTSFISLAASPNNKQCGVFEIAKKYELELNRAWWYQGSLNSGYNQVQVKGPSYSFTRNGSLHCTAIIIMKNARTGKDVKYFSPFTVTEYRNGKKIALKNPTPLGIGK